MSTHPQTLVFWGAGATASIGLPLTTRQAAFLRSLAPRFDDPVQGIESRVRSALGNLAVEPWVSAFSDLLAILGDDDDTDGVRGGSPTSVLPDQFDAMARNWHSDNADELRQRVVELRTLYDWPALVAAINICPTRADHSSFELQDLFNVLDMNLQTGHGFRVRDDRFLPPQRVLGARGALVLLIQTLFYVAWHADGRHHENLRHHYDFAEALARRMQRDGLRIAQGIGDAELETDPFIRGDVAFVSMNWDPLGLWPQFVANRTLNELPNVPLVGSPAKRLWMFHDLGHFVAGPRVDKGHPGNKVWQPMNESSARQLNDPHHGADVRIRVSKYLFPHGCLWWRECPNCGKLSSYIGDEWATDSATLLPPPPLEAFRDGIEFESWTEDKLEADEWSASKVDARACVHCRTLTYAHHTPLVVQTNLKGLPPPFLQEIQRDMRVVVQHADHVIFMGYSLPPDDVTYRAFLAARTTRTGNQPLRCSVVDKTDPGEFRWLYPDELETRHGVPEVVKSTQALFGPKNVRFYGAGIPQVFLGDGGRVTDAAVQRLLNWE